jgi:hypothetical protein
MKTKGYHIHLLLIIIFFHPVLFTAEGLSMERPGSVTYNPFTSCVQLRPFLVLEGNTSNRSLAHEKPSGHDWIFTDDMPVHPPNGTALDLWPEMTVDSEGMLHVVWFNNEEGPYHVYYAQSMDGGYSWCDPEKVDEMTEGDYAKFPSVAVDDAGNVYAAWEDDREGEYNIYFSRRIWNGKLWEWTPDFRVNTRGGSQSPSDWMDASISASGDGRVVIAWVDWREGVYHQIYSRRSSDGGDSWFDEVRVSHSPGLDPVFGQPVVTIDPFDASGQTVYCYFHDWEGSGWRFPDCAFSRSNDGGENWTERVIVNDTTSYFQQNGSRSFGVDLLGNLFAMWYNDDDWGPVPDDMRVSRSTDHGDTWQPGIVVSDPRAVVGIPPSLSVGPEGNLYAVWCDWRDLDGPGRVAFSFSGDWGATWSDPDHLLGDQEAQWTYYPTVAALPGESFTTVFSDYRAWYYDLYAVHGERSGDMLLIRVLPELTTVSPGDVLAYRGAAFNLTDHSLSSRLHADLYLPGGKPYPFNPVLGPFHMILPEYAYAMRSRADTIPETAPHGTYRYAVTAVDPPDTLATAYFEFEVADR